MEEWGKIDRKARCDHENDICFIAAGKFELNYDKDCERVTDSPLFVYIEHCGLRALIASLSVEYFAFGFLPHKAVAD